MCDRVNERMQGKNAVKLNRMVSHQRKKSSITTPQNINGIYNQILIFLLHVLFSSIRFSFAEQNCNAKYSYHNDEISDSLKIEKLNKALTIFNFSGFIIYCVLSLLALKIHSLWLEQLTQKFDSFTFNLRLYFIKHFQSNNQRKTTSSIYNYILCFASG